MPHLNSLSLLALLGPAAAQLIGISRGGAPGYLSIYRDGGGFKRNYFSGSCLLGGAGSKCCGHGGVDPCCSDDDFGNSDDEVDILGDGRSLVRRRNTECCFCSPRNGYQRSYDEIGFGG